jgi:hypothetical protein
VIETLHQRKNLRFSLHYPIRLEFSSGGRNFQVDALTRNLSVGGLLLESPYPIPMDCSVNFTISAEGEQMVCPLEFAGSGEVVRVDPVLPGLGYAVALRYARPIQCRRP